MKFFSQLRYPTLFYLECLPNAKELLDEVDNLLRVIESGADLVEDGVYPRCRMCGRGEYLEPELPSYSFYIDMLRHWKIVVCNNCDHLEFFAREWKPKPIQGDPFAGR